MRASLLVVAFILAILPLAWNGDTQPSKMTHIIWMANLADNTARHMVDPGPTFNCRLPMFAFDAEALRTKLGELEFGHELEFFRDNGAKQVDGPKLSLETKSFELKLDDSTLL